MNIVIDILISPGRSLRPIAMIEKQEIDMPCYQQRDIDAAVDDVDDFRVAVEEEIKERAVEAMQYLIDTQVVWTMRDRYQRIATKMVEKGWCHVTLH
jgi:hypothetical protein